MLLTYGAKCECSRHCSTMTLAFTVLRISTISEIPNRCRPACLGWAPLFIRFALPANRDPTRLADKIPNYFTGWDVDFSADVCMQPLHGYIGILYLMLGRINSELTPWHLSSSLSPQNRPSHAGTGSWMSAHRLHLCNLGYRLLRMSMFDHI